MPQAVVRTMSAIHFDDQPVSASGAHTHPEKSGKANAYLQEHFYIFRYTVLRCQLWAKFRCGGGPLMRFATARRWSAFFFLSGDWFL
jgi:hypothetical protein